MSRSRGSSGGVLAHRGLRAAYRLVGAAVVAALSLQRSFMRSDPLGRRKIAERLGEWATDFAERGGGRNRWVWIQAASVGEVMAVRPLVVRLRERFPQLRILLTCNTATGRATAESVGCDSLHYFPIDYRPVVERVVRGVRPALFVAVETEIWPTTLRVLQSNGVATAFVNARISERSFPRYLRIRALLAQPLSQVSAVCCRDADSASRWLALGVDAQRLTVTGDMKYDGIGEAEVEATVAPLAGGDFRVLLAASTHAGEEEVAVEAFALLRARRGGGGEPLRLVLAPRHPERARQVHEDVCARLGRDATVVLWQDGDIPERWDVLVVDTVGLLRGFMKASDVIFMGGSLVSVGGHNLLEPAAFALPIASGPHLSNVALQAQALREVGALRPVEDAASLAAVWQGWLADEASRLRAGHAGRALLGANRGAVEATMARLQDLLDQQASTPSGAATAE